MSRLRSTALTICLASVIVLVAAATVGHGPLAPAPGHAFLHIDCPPGSHGKPWQSGIGQKLQDAREARGKAARSLEERSLTNGHPGL